MSNRVQCIPIIHQMLPLQCLEAFHSFLQETIPECTLHLSIHSNNSIGYVYEEQNHTADSLILAEKFDTLYRTHCLDLEDTIWLMYYQDMQSTEQSSITSNIFFGILSACKHSELVGVYIQAYATYSLLYTTSEIRMIPYR